MPRGSTANAFVLALAGVVFTACGRDALDAFPTTPSDPDSDDSAPMPPPDVGPPEEPFRPGDVRLRFESEQIDFGLVKPGASKELKIGLTNESDRKVPGPKLSLAGDLVFQILDTTCDLPLEPADECSVNVRFAPRAEAHFSTALVASTGVANAEMKLVGRSTETPETMTGLVGHWTFENLQSSVVPDLSGSKNEGLVVEGLSPTAGAGKPALVPGRKPGASAIDFSRGTTWVRVKVSSSINITGIARQFTLAAWVRSNATPKEGLQWVICRQETGSAQKHFGLGLQDGMVMGAVHFFFAAGATPFAQDGKWHHIAAAYDGITLRVYQDGFLVSAVDIGWPIDQDSTPVAIGAGQDATQMSEFFQGEVDEVQLFAKNLSDAEVLLLAK